MYPLYTPPHPAVSKYSYSQTAGAVVRESVCVCGGVGQYLTVWVARGQHPSTVFGKEERLSPALCVVGVVCSRLFWHPLSGRKLDGEAKKKKKKR